MSGLSRCVVVLSNEAWVSDGLIASFSRGRSPKVSKHPRSIEVDGLRLKMKSLGADCDQERRESLIRRAHACVLAYDARDPASLTVLSSQRELILRIKENGRVSIMLVAYCEKTMSSDISTDDARSLALKWACPFFECCATDSKRLEEVILELSHQLFANSLKKKKKIHSRHSKKPSHQEPSLGKEKQPQMALDEPESSSNKAFEEMKTLLAQLEMTQYADIFEEQAIDIETLTLLSDEDLEAVGVKALGHRRKLMKAAKDMIENKSTVPSPRNLGVLMIDSKDIVLGKKIGSGSFGAVYKGVLRGVTTVAVKQLKEKDSNLQDALFAEAQLMSRISPHANVVTFFGVSRAEGVLNLVVEFVPDGSLDEFLRECIQLPVSVHLSICKHIAAGMEHLHAHNIVHRDLAARNLLLERRHSGEYIVKVCDFGLSRALEDSYYHTTQSKIPFKWTSPEAIRYRKFTQKSDVWSFGVTMWEIFSYGEVPYSTVSNHELLDFLDQNNRLSCPSSCPPEICDLMMQCMHRLPEERPTFTEIIEKLGEFERRLKSGSLTSIYTPINGNFSVPKQKNRTSNCSLSSHRSRGDKKKSSSDSAITTQQYFKKSKSSDADGLKKKKREPARKSRSLRSDKDKSKEDDLMQEHLFGFSRKLEWAANGTESAGVQALLRVGDTVWAGHAKGSISVWNAHSGQQATVIKGSPKEKIYSLLYVNGKIWSCSDEHVQNCVIRIWDPKTLVQEDELKAHDNLVRCMLWLETYNQVWSADVSGNIIIWDATTYTQIKEFVVRKNESLFSMCQVGDCVWLGTSSDIICLDLKTFAMFNWRAHERPINDLLHYDHTVWSCANDCKVKIWKSGNTPQNVYMLKEVDVSGSIFCLRQISIRDPVTRKKSVVICGGHNDGSVITWNARKQEQIQKFGLQAGAVRCLLWVPGPDLPKRKLSSSTTTTTTSSSTPALWTGSRDHSICLWTIT